MASYATTADQDWASSTKSRPDKPPRCKSRIQDYGLSVNAVRGRFTRMCSVRVKTVRFSICGRKRRRTLRTRLLCWIGLIMKSGRLGLGLTGRSGCCVTCFSSLIRWRKSAFYCRSTHNDMCIFCNSNTSSLQTSAAPFRMSASVAQLCSVFC